MDKKKPGSVLDKPLLLKQLDKSQMLATVASWPELLKQANQFLPSLALGSPKKIKQIVICGMGGSAIAGDITAALLLNKVALPVFVIRNYTLPAYIGADSLVFAISYSGETEETLTAVKEAHKRKAKIICLCSNGKLRDFAERNQLPCYLVPAGFQPRAATAFLLIPVLNTLLKLGIEVIKSADLDETINVLSGLRDELDAAKPTKTNLAKQIAQKLVGKTTLIFAMADTLTQPAAVRFKTQLNENSKATALVNFFPELNHNEVVNLATLKRTGQEFALLILRDENDNERLKKRVKITKSLIASQLGGAIEIYTKGQSALARLLSLVYVADFVSVYLAFLKGIDPTPVEVITRFKKELNR